MAENQNTVGGYELRNCVASGRTTQIWEVSEQGSAVQMAMKLMLDESRKKPELKAILKHEFRIGSQLDHPSIVRFHKIEINRDHAFFIMDYFRAPNLKSQIGSSLAETQSRFKKIVEAITQGFAHLHDKGWLHCDIKPDNILVNKTGEVRIIDFSLSRRKVGGLGKLFAGRLKVIQGTRTYIPPEVILKRVPTVQSDIYSLGVTLYEILTGAPPFAGTSPNDLLKKHLGETPAPPSLINPNVSPELDLIILKMLAKKPKDRPADMRELHASFRSLKCFLEDPMELHDKIARESKEREAVSVDKRLDSRADADRTERGVAAPVKQKKAKPKTAALGELEPVKRQGATRQAGASQSEAPGMMPYAMPQPMMPQPMMMGPMMPPPMMMPQMPPAMMMPQMNPVAPAPVMMPQMMPGVQPGMIPGGGGPGFPAGAANVNPAMIPPAVAPQNPPASGASAGVNSEAAKKVVNLPLERRRAPTPAADPAAAQNLDFMTELPDIS
ncbi:MAG: serine/threonine protein kinase [Planctomyces sp.]